MGNICGKAEGDPFATPGRRLGSAPEPVTRASVPAKQQGKTVDAGRRLGGSGGPVETGTDDARRKAAAAAEARSHGGRAPGKLGTQLAQQKKQTHAETLNEASAANLRQREADAVAETLNHN